MNGNVIENAPLAGIMLGWGRYLRDVAATGNVVRKADIGIACLGGAGRGHDVVANNIITETPARRRGRSRSCPCSHHRSVRRRR